MGTQISPQFKRAVETEVRRLMEQGSPYRGNNNPAMQPYEIAYRSKSGQTETAWTWGRNEAQARMKVEKARDDVQRVTRVRLIGPDEWNKRRGKFHPIR